MRKKLKTEFRPEDGQWKTKQDKRKLRQKKTSDRENKTVPIVQK